MILMDICLKYNHVEGYILPMIKYFQNLLSHPGFYHYARQILLLGMPLKKWAEYGNYFDPDERIADLGCGPADILRFVDSKRKPDFYLGIDISDRYLRQAARKADRIGLASKFIRLDLSELSSDEKLQIQLIELLSEYKITTVNLFGVLHHIDDRSVISTLQVVSKGAMVKSLNTQDVLTIPDQHINNFYVSLDRGGHVRDEDHYDALIKKTPWTLRDKKGSQAGVRSVKYIHYRLHK